ncbi:MAG: hypothetical protein AVDCRST_MAG89-1032 [uncultured Gemmatimonadetes bacterium]|uniref:Prenyltransferase n=1 Tax=uncultured Gemmatimonadota bacterium TaxID=203437 RepID=A0A6J4KP16_9BACT|nr:MAG: hypothetical protein AVDCRST_MAG89-1032 [uncultured Gemmatimonadota bacterium]
MSTPGLLRLIRADDWWLYHLLPLLAAAYASIAFYAVPAADAYPALARLLLSIVCIAAYSHVVNDIGDAEQDAAAGKPDRWRGVGLGWRAAVAAVFLVCGFAVWWGAGLSRGTVALLVLIAALQPAYALAPLRLKERGAWGPVTDSLHTHALPTLYCVTLFAGIAGAPLWRPFPLALAAWSFFVGLRGIVYHQRIDEPNDRRAGVSTFVTTHGSERAAVLVRRFIFPAELAALVAVGIAVWGAAPAVVLAFAAYGGVMQLLRRTRTWPVTFADPAPADRTAYIPLLAFYRSWPAPAFALLLAVRDPRFLPLFVVHSVVFAGPILRQAADFARLLRWFWLAFSARVRRVWE